MSTYTPLTWSNGDPMTVERLNQMAENDQYLFERVIRSKYSWDGAERTEGVRIYAANHRFPNNSTKSSSIAINWDGFFSPGCNPIVVVTVGRRVRGRLWTTVQGPGGAAWPNSRGCEIFGTMDPDTGSNYNFNSTIPVHIIAMGY